ncbi:MAG: LysR family transcriptional regulator [Eubacteriales bacterium]|nr:LysR family transcriptional regulator [Eubacteriales bacterium]
MNWNQLQYMITIADEKSITGAAKKLFISQPSLSLSLRAMEDELGTPLFERKHGALQLTYAGSLFYEWALSVLHSRKQLSAKIGDIAANSRKLLRIGISPHRSALLLPGILKSFYQRYPDCEVQLTEQPTFLLRNLLEKNEIDFMIDVPHPDTLNYQSEVLADEKIVLAVPVSFTGEHTVFCRQSYIPLEKTAELPYIMLSPNHVIGTLSRKLCEASLFHPNIRITCASIDTALTLSAEQLGISFVPEIYEKRTRFSQQVRYYSIKHFEETRKICLITPKRDYQSEPLKYLLELFREVIPGMYR